MISGITFTATAAPLCSATHLKDANHFQWPKDEIIVDVRLAPLLAAEIRNSVLLQRNNKELGTVAWTGPHKFETLLMIQSNISERFPEGSLYAHASRDRGPLEAVLRTYLNLQADVGATKAKTIFAHMFIVLKNALETDSRQIVLERLQLICNCDTAQPFFPL